MRNKTFLPGFLFNFPHAMRFKGGGAPTVQPPAYNPPKPPPSPDSAVNYDVARNYFEGSYTGNAPAYSDEWNDSFNQWTSGLESDFGVDSYEKLNYGQLTGQVKPGTKTGDAPAPTPPSPDAPVTSNGQTVSQPTVTQPIPPVSDRSSEVQQAGRDARRQSKKRKGLLSTLLAGETGGIQAPKKTLLGQ